MASDAKPRDQKPVFNSTQKVDVRKAATSESNEVDELQRIIATKYKNVVAAHDLTKKQETRM